jgi:virulence-associated protein VagC
VPLPEEFRFETPTVSIRRQGDAVILEPVKPGQWPEHFFEALRIDDPAFERPDQGEGSKASSMLEPTCFEWSRGPAGRSRWSLLP